MFLQEMMMVVATEAKAGEFLRTIGIRGHLTAVPPVQRLDRAFCYMFR